MSVSYILIIPLLEAAKDPETYCLEDIIGSYSEDDMKDLWTPKANIDVDGDDYSIVDADTFNNKAIEVVEVKAMAMWSSGRLYNDFTETAIKADGQWYVAVGDDEYPDWL